MQLSATPNHAFLLIALGAGMAHADTWRELKRNPGANFYDILKAHQAEEAANPREASEVASDAFEQLAEGEYHFERWREQVEVRVQPTGDLSLLSTANEEMRNWMGLDGGKVPSNNGNWTFMGPNGDPAGRTFTGIPTGNGRLNFVRFHPTDRNYLLVGSPGGGLWISRDAGASWKPATDRITVLGVADVAVDPRNTDILYITTGDKDGSDTRSVGVLKSIDGGQTWNTTGLAWKVEDNKEGQRILIHPENSSILLHGGSDGIYRSTDGGATFTKATGITEMVRTIEYKPGDPNTVYAGGRSAYYSTNGGVSWTAATGPSTLTSGSRMVIAVTPAAPEKVWAYTSASNLHVSTNGGRTYTFVGVGATVGQSGYNLSVAISNTDPDEMVTGQVQMKRSTDGGRTWVSFQTGSHWDVHGLAYQPGTDILYSANDGGLYRSQNGGAWTSMNTSLQVSQMYRLGVSKANPLAICNGYQDNGTTLLMPGIQTRIGGADGFECFFDHENPNTIYIESQNGGHQRCTWNGTSATCSGVTSGLSGSGSWNTAWGMDPKVASTIYTTRGSTLYKSTARGTGWTPLASMGGTGSIRDFAISPSNTQVIYVILGGQLYRTANGGTSWSNRSTGLSGTPTYVAIHPETPDRIWVSISGYTAGRKVYSSTDGGTTWINYSDGLPNLPANTVVAEPGSNGGVYVGMDVGVFYRNAGLTTWQPYFQNLPNVSVRELEIGGTGPTARLYAATYGRGAWYTPLWGNAPVSLREVPGDVSEVSLSDFKAAARPDGREVEISFHLNSRKAGAVKVQVVSLAGKVVFEAETAATGFFSRRVDLGRMGKGTFLVRIPGTRIARRVSLL